MIPSWLSRVMWIVLAVVVLLLLIRLFVEPERGSIADEATGEETFQIVSLLPRDAIPAIDNPQFVSGADADAIYHPEEIVLGVEIDGDARAYSVPFLRGHENVNDEVGGTPVAVTW